MILAAWFHNLSPFAIRFTDSFGIRWYGLAYLCGFAVAYFGLRAMSKRGLIALPVERIGDAMLWLIAGVLVGGRVGYAVAYDLPNALQMGVRPLLFSFSNQFPFWDLLAINQGGMASHGGIVGVILASWRISRGFKNDQGRIVGRMSVMHTLDALALVTPAGLFFGRIANFINGELLGKIITRSGVEGPWYAVQFPQELDQFREDAATGKILSGAGLEQTVDQWHQILALAREISPPPNGTVLTGLRTLAHESYRFNGLADKLKPLVSSRHPSQLYQAAAEGLVLAIVLWAIWAHPRKAGVVGCWFMIAYGVLRVLTEFVRLPDAQLAVQRIYGFSRGQWLSVTMVAAGFVILWFVLKDPAAKVGGWRTRPRAG